MVKHTQSICWQQPTNCLNVFDHFVGLALKWLIHFLFAQKNSFLVVILQIKTNMKAKVVTMYEM